MTDDGFWMAVLGGAAAFPIWAVAGAALGRLVRSGTALLVGGCGLGGTYRYNGGAVDATIRTGVPNGPCAVPGRRRPPVSIDLPSPVVSRPKKGSRTLHR